MTALLKIIAYVLFFALLLFLFYLAWCSAYPYFEWDMLRFLGLMG